MDDVEKYVERNCFVDMKIAAKSCICSFDIRRDV